MSKISSWKRSGSGSRSENLVVICTSAVGFFQQDYQSQITLPVADWKRAEQKYLVYISFWQEGRESKILPKHEHSLTDVR